jgi:hypothetical protein
MEKMLIINFYKEHQTTWDELKTKALDTITEFEKEANSNVGNVSHNDYYEDYKQACSYGLKTFILQVINEWIVEDVLYFNDKFYKKFKFIEIDGQVKNFSYNNLFKNREELFSYLNKEKVKLSSDSFDEIHESFTIEKDIISNVSYFEYDFIDVQDDKDWLDENGFGNILE